MLKHEDVLYLEKIARQYKYDYSWSFVLKENQTQKTYSVWGRYYATYTRPDWYQLLDNLSFEEALFLYRHLKMKDYSENSIFDSCKRKARLRIGA